MNTEVHDIFIPYLVRFVWASAEAQKEFQEKIIKARRYLANEFPKMLVDQGIAQFAPVVNLQTNTKIIAEAIVSNHYPTRWNSMDRTMRSHSNLINTVGVYGSYQEDFNPAERWDLMRDLYQLALAPDCCKKAYFESPFRDPYHYLYEKESGKIKRINSGETNSLLAPFGLFISPIVPCSLNCEHAHAKANDIANGIKTSNEEVYELVKLVTEMPLRIDSYRGMACVDTPMFLGVYGTDAYKQKNVLDVKVKDPEVFSYDNDWTAKGTRFPFKGIFSI